MLGAGHDVVYRTVVSDATAAGVNSTIGSLNRIDAAFERLEKRETETTREADQLRKAFERVQRSADPLARAQERYASKLDVAKRALREGAASTTEYERTVRGLNQQLKTAETRAAGAGARFGVLSRAMRTFAGAAAAAGVSVSAIQFGRDAIDNAAAFQQQMANVSAVTGAVGKQLDRLGQQARDLGATTAFSASEAAAGMENLGRAGFATAEIMAAIPGTLDLAAAGQLGLARAAEISSGVLRGFQKDASEAAHVSDVLAAASVKSNQEIEDLGEAMKFAAPTAKLFGISLEEATASIAKLADSGLKGGIGGRGFQALVTRLEKNRDDVTAIIGDFDVAAEGLTSILRRLGDANISNAQAIEIFSAENLDVYTVLAAGARDAANGTDQLTEALKRADGEARRIAQIQFKTFRGLVDELGEAQTELRLAFAGVELGKVGAGSGALPALERTVQSITTALRSDDAKAFATALGKDVGGAIDAIRENWDGVVTVTKAATAAAVAYGVASAGGAVAKGVAAIQAQVALVSEQTALERAYQIAVVNTTQAEAAKTAARLAEAQATRTSLAANLAALEIQRAQAVEQLAFQRAMAVSTGRQAGVAAAQAQLNASTRGLIQTRRALAATEAELALAQTAASGAAATAAQAQAGYATTTASATAATIAGTTAAGRMALAYTGLATAARASGQALAFASVGGLGGIARALPAVTKTLAAATALSAINFGRAIAQVTGLSAALSFLATPAGALIGLSAAVVLFGDRLDGSRQKIRSFDASVRDAFQNAGEELPDRLRQGLQKSKEDLERFEADYRRILASIGAAQGEEIAKAQREAERRASARGGYLGVALPSQSPAATANADAARRAQEAAAQRAVYRERFGDAPLGVFRPGFEASDSAQTAFQSFNDKIKDFSFLTASAEAEAARLGITVEELAERQRQAASDTEAHASAAADLAKSIDNQRDALTRQIEKMRALNEARRAGRSEDDVEALTRRIELRERYDDLSKAEFDRLADEYEAQYKITEELDRQKAAREDLAEKQQRAAEDAAIALQREQQRFADTATDLMVDIWRSFRREGESAIDVIKDYLRHSLDNVVGNIFQNFFNKIFTGGSSAPFGSSGGGFGGGFGVALNAFGGGSISNGLSGGPGVAPSSGGVAALVAQANQTIANPFSSATAYLSSIYGENGVLNRAGQSVGKALGFKAGAAAFGDAFAGAGAGYSISQLTTPIYDALGVFKGRGNTGAAVGGTIGGAAGSLIAGPLGSIIGGFIGSTLGKVFGALVGGKPSDKIGQLVLDPVSGRVLGTGQKDNSEESLQNLALAQKIGDLISEQVGAIAELTGAKIADDAATAAREDLLNIATGSRDGIQLGNQGAAGEIANRQQFENTEEGAQAAVAAGINLSIKALQGGDKALTELAKALAAAGEPIDSITQKLATVKDALAINADQLSEWEQAAKQIKDAFAEAIAVTGKASEAEKALTEARAAALTKLGQNFDKEIERRTLEIEAPQEAAAAAIFEEQARRIKDIAAVSQSAAEEEARLAKVIALNTAELKQFIDQASTAPEALAAASAALDRYASELEASGADPALLRAQISAARDSLASEINRDTAQRLLNIANPALAQFNQLLVEQKSRLDAALSVGANVGGVERLNALERQKFLEGLSDEDRAGIGNVLGLVEDSAGRMSFVLSDLRIAFENQITHVDDVTERYETAASQWKAANDNLRGALGDIRQEFRGGSLQNQLDQALQRFDVALATAGQAGLGLDARTAAQNELGGLGREALEVARTLYGTAPQFQSIFDRIERGLDASLGAGVGLETENISQAEAARQSLDALRRIDNALAQPSLDLPVLEESRDRLAAIEDHNVAFVERLEELIELSRRREAEAATSVEQLAGVNAPVLPSSGNPVADVQTAKDVIAAVLKGATSTTAAVAAAAEAQNESNEEVASKLQKVVDAVESNNVLLRRLIEILGGGATVAAAA